jgi:negative regulator of flagellin synthesis FlgM
MHINGPIHVHGPQPINPPHRTHAQPPSAPAAPAGGADQVDISAEADMISRTRELPSIRADRVAQIRAQIEAGTYETAEKLSGAVDRLLDEIG